MKKCIVLLLFFIPSLVRAEGQYALDIVWDVIDFIKVFTVWGVTVLFSIRVLDYFKKDKLSKRQKNIIWLITALFALLIWSII